ncbi:MAG: NAD-dependent epimerase/dehydratase family protein [Magnetospirillum sp.]|nr:NAD-dependent epimerase/dehydratase family protein [Magnetospirillum sp.]
MGAREGGVKVLVTGATGFVGAPVCRVLAGAGMAVVAAVRREGAVPAGIEARMVGDLGPTTDWGPALCGIDAVVHLAARAHVMDEREADPLTVFRAVNRDGALRLAEQAAAAGVRRLVFVSSIKVNGEATPLDRPFRADDPPRPCDPYGIAKAEAEERLTALADRTGLAVVTIRPPLVHGPGAKGNLAVLMRVLARRLPLPLGAIRNRRSLVGIANLADAIRFSLVTEAAAGQVLLVRDGEDVSTPDLLRRLGTAMGSLPLLLPVPPALLTLAGRLTGRQAMIERLTGSLTVDDGPLRALGWRPPLTLDQGLAQMVGGVP